MTYATGTKASLLGVPEDLLAAEGAVHPDVAAHMARGARRLAGADLGLAVTGVAGPEPQDGRPVGTVYAAVAGTGPAPRVEHFRFDGDRSGIRYRTVEGALAILVAAVHDGVADHTRG